MEQQLIHKKLDEEGLVGEVVLPSGGGSYPAVIYIGGSSGTIRIDWAESLAREGFAAVALGYFGSPGLPPHLADIPTEYFEKAARWLLEQSYVEGGKVGVIGLSRGSEATLQLATISDSIGALVGYVPSSVRWTGAESDPTWTYDGKPLPFVRWPKGLARRELYDRVLDNPEAYKAAIIEVEKARCPMLFISGGDDQLWPSDRMAEQIIARLEEHKFGYPYKHLNYSNAGHRIGLPNLSREAYEPITLHKVTGEKLNYGGSVIANQDASTNSWLQVVKFLHKNL